MEQQKQCSFVRDLPTTYLCLNLDCLEPYIWVRYFLCYWIIVDVKYTICHCRGNENICYEICQSATSDRYVDMYTKTSPMEYVPWSKHTVLLCLVLLELWVLRDVGNITRYQTTTKYKPCAYFIESTASWQWTCMADSLTRWSLDERGPTFRSRHIQMRFL